MLGTGGEYLASTSGGDSRLGERLGRRHETSSAKQHALRFAPSLLIALGVIVWTFVAGTHEAHAADALQGMQDAITAQFSGWLNNGLTYATELFAVVGVTGAIVTGVNYYVKNSTWEGVHFPLVDILLRLIVPLVLLRSAATFLPGIFGFASRLAGGITGIKITGPGDILHLGFVDAIRLYQASTVPIMRYLVDHPTGVLGIVSGFSTSSAFFLALALVAIGAAAAISIVIAFAFIAAELLVATVNILFVTSIGAIQLGWAAAPGTSDMAATYWAGVQASVFRVIIIYAVASFITSAAATAFGTPSDTADVYTMCLTAVSAMAFAWAAFYLAVRIPHLAENAFSGRPVFTGSSAVDHGMAPAFAAGSAASAGFATARAAMAKRAAVASVRRAGD